jgi:hypothetical protein
MLAAIIAHEIAHIMLKHGLEMINSLRLNDEMGSHNQPGRGIAGSNSPAARRTLHHPSQPRGTFCKCGTMDDRKLPHRRHPLVLVQEPMSVSLNTFLQRIEPKKSAPTPVGADTKRERIPKCSPIPARYAIYFTP